MSNFPDFSNYAYQIQSELGNNSAGGRITYLAQNIETQESVVIKQFQFAQLGATWSEYDAYQEEIKVLQSLHHPQIPRYLDSFQTADGFCMVQEYKNAQSLATIRSWKPQEIKQIAISVLSILAYLQRQSTPIIHRDIKPENILMDEQMNVYLVDFGFARMGGGEVAVSSVVKGTLGFMPPEQLFNREITKASDLYGLGAMLICLLTGTKSVDIGSLIDANYYIRFRHLVPPLQRGWMNWLEKMVEPNPKDRFANAAEALKAIENIDITAIPKLRINRDKLEVTATKFGEKVTQSITISNPIPATLLAGNWEVAPHKSDPPHSPYEHAWISFTPYRFESNEIECKITVDTSKLLANETYSRQILLRTNSDPENYSIAVEVKTAPLPEALKPNYLLLAGVGVLFGFFGLVLGGVSAIAIFFIPITLAVFLAWDKTTMTIAEGAKVNQFEQICRVSLIGQFCGSFVGLFLVNVWDIGWLVGGCVGALMGISWISKSPILLVHRPISYIEKGFHQKASAQTTLLTAGLGISLGFGFSVFSTFILPHWFDISGPNLSLIETLMTILALALILPLVNLLIYQPLKRGRFIANYHRTYSHLIKP